MSYSADHAGAYADVKAAGAAVTFSVVTQTYNATTDAMTGVTTTVAGYAMQVRGNPREFEALGVVERQPIVLLFAPTTYGDVPTLGSTVTWGGASYTVKDTMPIAPDGTAILSRVTVIR